MKGRIMDNRDKGTNKKLWLIIVMIVVIVILLGVIAFLSGKDHGKTTPKVVKTVKVESATTKKSQSQVASSMNNSQKSQSSSVNTGLQVGSLGPRQTAAVIAYYIGQKGFYGMNPWSQVSDASRKPVMDISKIPDSLNLSQPGTGLEYTFTESDGRGYGGACFYTLSNNGQTVNIYNVTPGMDPNAQVAPVNSSSLADIVQFANHDNMADAIRQAANNIQIQDNE